MPRLLILLATLLVAGGVCRAEQTFLIRLGVGDSAPRDWSGSLKVDGGRLISLRSWQFGEGDTLDASGTWTAHTAVEEYWHAPWERSLFGTKRLTKTSERGLILTVEGDQARVRAQTEQGAFDFSASRVGWDRETSGLGGSVVVGRAPLPVRATDDSSAEDFPALLCPSEGDSWVAWQTYSAGGERLWVRNGDQAPEALTEAGRNLFRVELAEGEDGVVWAVWAERHGENWDLYARSRRDGAWSAEQRLTNAPGGDIFHSLASDSDGKLYLAWQSLRDGQAEIYLKVHDGTAWGVEIRITRHEANDWAPTVAADGGRVAVVWDSYRNGKYDLFLRFYENGSLGELQTVVASPSFEARPQARFAPDGRLWLVWEEGDPEWGKDYVNGVFEAGMGLLMKRRTRVAIWGPDGLEQPTADLAEALPAEHVQIFQSPRLAFDGSGAPWVLFRYRTNNPQGAKPTYRAMWRLGATSLRDGKWSPMVRFPGGFGRIDAPTAVCRDRQGDLRVVWPSDGRRFPSGFPGEPDLFEARIPAAELPERPLGLVGFEPPIEEFAVVHPDEQDDVERLRSYRRRLGGKQWRVVRGDMHRHTDVSWDGNRDGSLFDAYRYAMDAAAMDYLGVADHGAGEGIEHHWRAIERAADLFWIPGKFTPLYGYERSRGYPSGHRNVMFAQRGVPVFPFSQAEREDNAGTSVEPLFEHLRQNGGIVMSHTSGTGAGTDWRDRADDVEPLVEIYQGYRTSYEHQGAPRSTEVGARPAGFVWKAWEKGLKLGVQASSDHVSTHASYAMIWVDELSREAILDGIRARRAYAATDNILLEFRVSGALMGAEISVDQAPRIDVHVVGTGPVRKIEVIRDNAYVHTHTGGAAEQRFEFVDNDAEPGEHWYYVRVEQEDGELAWASPVWVTVR